ncbi:MAG: hypothetical protein J5851_01200 [Oscillospiraceae bacterium]|nr:hypothetical protein [Oscillospiraceae bacterium]
MRTYDEMFQSVLVRRDAYRAAQTVRRRKLRYVTTFGAAAMLCCLLTVTAAKLVPGRLPTLPPVPDTTITATDPTQPTETESTVTEQSDATEAAPAKATEPTEPDATEPATDLAEPTETAAAETAAPTEEAQPVTKPAATEPERPTVTEAPAPTEAPAISPTEATLVSPSDEYPEEATEAPLVSPTEAPVQPELVTEALGDGFVVEYRNGCKRIVCTDIMPAKTGTLSPYEFISDGFYLVSLTENDGVNEYLVRSGMESPKPPEFTVTQQEFQYFSVYVDEDAEISVNISLGRRRGFFILEGDTCTLYWFVDNECFRISGADSDLRDMLAIARSFEPADQ